MVLGSDSEVELHPRVYNRLSAAPIVTGVSMSKNPVDKCTSHRDIALHCARALVAAITVAKGGAVGETLVGALDLVGAG